jgi:hypothetical protein
MLFRIDNIDSRMLGYYFAGATKTPRIKPLPDQGQGKLQLSLVKLYISKHVVQGINRSNRVQHLALEKWNVLFFLSSYHSSALNTFHE